MSAVGSGGSGRWVYPGGVGSGVGTGGIGAVSFGSVGSWLGEPGVLIGKGMGVGVGVG